MLNDEEMLTPSEREAKLPEWVKVLLRDLRTAVAYELRRADEARQDAATAAGHGPADSDTFVDMDTAEVPLGLGRGVSVRYVGSTGHEFEVRMDRTGELVVEASQNLAVVPVGPHLAHLRGEPVPHR